jgi:DNA-binding MarR family transcriptional regulator
MKEPNNDVGVRSAAAGEGLAGLFTLAALLGHAMDQGLAERGLTRARGEVIWTLQHRGGMTQRELSQALDCSAPNVTGLLDALQAAGFVTRGPHPTDRRATLVELTELGKRTASEWSAGAHEFATTLFADLATPQLTDFVSALNRVLAQLRAAVPTRPGDTG